MDILEIEILTDNLDETEIFYSVLLGLKIRHKNHNSISFIAGHSTLTFIKSNNLNPNYHFAFNIPHNKLEEAIKWTAVKFDLIKNAENEIITNFESWNAKSIYFFDNNNNVLEFIARFDLDNYSDKPFEGSSIESISEIGIVTDSPIQLANKILKKSNISFFMKGAKSEKFATLGNDNGLFIIVETNRKWYPTEIQAKKLYSKIKISTGGLIQEIRVNEDNISR